MKLRHFAAYQIQPFLIFGGKKEKEENMQTASGTGGTPIGGGLTGSEPPIREGEEEEDPKS
ncbi:MAG: hypothetical protein WBB45_19910 [Cyclobacteriaceae bacterium]